MSYARSAHAGPANYWACRPAGGNPSGESHMGGAIVLRRNRRYRAKGEANDIYGRRSNESCATP